jgi:hypothetical protein
MLKGGQQLWQNQKRYIDVKPTIAALYMIPIEETKKARLPRELLSKIYLTSGAVLSVAQPIRPSDPALALTP